MILKKLKRTSFRKPKATMIGDLVDYILQPRDENGNDKLTYHGARNFIAGTQAGQKAEMIDLASESIRSPMPVTHWIMSWQENEQPSHKQIEDAVDVFLERMGLVGHQVVYALHGNTANVHLHIAVNRTNPDTLKVIQPHKGFDIEEAHRIVALLVHKQGWAAEENARYRVNDKGEIVRNPGGKGLVKPRPEAEHFESATGEKSAQRVAQERGHAVIQNAKTWTELHAGLVNAGLRFEKKGSGAIVFVGDVAVKASSIDRNFCMGKLCKRLGEFEPGDYAPEMKTPEPEPISSIGADEWREYRRCRVREAKERREARKRHVALLERAKAAHREHRQNALVALARHGIHILNIARHFLKIKQREELDLLRTALREEKKPLPRFQIWLAERSKRARNLWKYRRRIASGAEIKAFQFPRIGKMASPYAAYREAIRKKCPDKPDESRLDAMIALWMRATGYSYQEVGNEIAREARMLRRQESRNWPDYAQRLINYAFGASGDIDIAAFRPSPEKILAFHQEAKRLKTERQRPQEAPGMRMR
jgi:hypothetical protein